MIDASVRGLQAEDYTPTQIESALATVFGVDSQLIADGTYFVAEAKQHDGTGLPGAADGASARRSTAAIIGRREDELLNPQVDAAKIRAFFVHPSWARRGVGSLILKACEDAAAAAGFRRCEMGATLTGVKLFGAKGYVALENISVPLKNGEGLPVVRMTKQLV